MAVRGPGSGVRDPVRHRELIVTGAVRMIVRSGLRGMAQSGSAPALGAGCRGFKSLCPDQ